MFGAIKRAFAEGWGKVTLVSKGYSPRRSSKWPKLRKAWLAANPTCVCCNRRATDVHHKIPFHYRPEWELDLSNLASVCKKDHLAVGHCGNWSLWQNNFDEISELMRDGICGGPTDT